MRPIYALFAAATILIAGCAKNDTDEMATPPADTSTTPGMTTEPSPTPPPEETMPPATDTPQPTDTPPAETPPTP